MTTISQLNDTTSTTKTTASEKSNTLGQDQFLTLLVAQLQNQDPLNPADATEFTAQLAQYSQLEQLFNLNDAMEGLTEAQTNAQKISALSLMGKEVVVEDSQFTYDGNPTELGYTVDGTASRISLDIQNSSGRTVATINATDLKEGEHFVTWNGRDNNGNALEKGTYKIVINATSAEDGGTVTVAPLVRATVTGVDLSGSEPMVVTANGEFKISSVHGAYDKAASTTTTNTSDSETAAQQEATAATGSAVAETAAATEDIFSAATDGAGIIEESAASSTAN